MIKDNVHTVQITLMVKDCFQGQDLRKCLGTTLKDYIEPKYRENIVGYIIDNDIEAKVK